MSSPLVSVCITAYNHEPFIAQAIESVLRQKTSFNFEILIGEDSSTDNTFKICQEYLLKFPNKIRLFQHDRKDAIYINGRVTGRYNFVYNLKSANGKYIALLDGDDFWLDSNKLENQVAFLERNPEYSFAFNGGKILKDNILSDDFLNERTPDIITPEYIAIGNCIRTHSVIFRNFFKSDFPELILKTPVADYVLHIMNSNYGKGKFFKEQWGVYRIHSGGVWSSYKTLEMRKEWLNMLYQIKGLFKSDLAKKNFSIQTNQVFITLLNLLISSNKIDDIYEVLKLHLDQNPEFKFIMDSFPNLDSKPKGFLKKIFNK